MKSHLTESAALLAPVQDVASKGIWRSRIIQADVHGSSGYYPSETLQAYGPTAFPAGTQVFFDHPSADEEMTRPERSVKDLAGVFLDDARFEDGPDGRGLFTRIQFFPDVRERVRAIANTVGLSIRASGQVEETAQGRIVRSLEGISVDLVTRAGAGGRLVRMTESAVAPAAQGGGAAHNASSGPTDYSELTKLSLTVDRLTEAFQNQTVGITKLLHLIKEREKLAQAQAQEIQQMRENFSKVMEADLPNSSKARIIESYQAGHDMDDRIVKERDYLKSVLRERDLKGAKDGVNKETAALGLSESLGSSAKGAGASLDDFAEIESVLSGKLF